MSSMLVELTSTGVPLVRIVDTPPQLRTFRVYWGEDYIGYTEAASADEAIEEAAVLLDIVSGEVLRAVEV